METSEKLEKRLRLVRLWGGFLCLMSLILYMGVPKLVEMKLDEQFLLYDNTTVFKYWYDIPIPLYLKVYIFNVTNPQRAKKGHPVELSEVGPYVYRITAKKEKLKWGKGNKTLSFDNRYMMYFEESLSEGKETDVVTVINLPAVVAADYGMTEKYEEFSFFINDEMEEAGEELFINLRVKEFLFQGYESKFLHGLAQYSSDVYDILPDAMFGVFYGQNNSVIKNITVFTGVDNKNLLGKIYALGGKRSVNYWDDYYCNMINGSDGISFQPGLTSSSTLRFYLFQLQRSFALKYIGEDEIRDIPVTEFTLEPTTFDGPDKNPDNKCFCDVEVCKYSGIFACKALKAAKIFASLPHFTGADEELHMNVLGLKPDEEKYKITFYVQPDTGFTLEFEFMLQLNILITPSWKFKVVKYLKSSQLFPVIWFCQEAKLTPEFAKEVYDLLIAPVKLADNVTLACFILGVTSIVGSVIASIYMSQKKGKEPGKVMPISEANPNA